MLTEALKDREAIINFDSLKEGVETLEKCRRLRIYIDEITREMNRKLLSSFDRERIEEYYLGEKLVKPATFRRYDYSKLVSSIPLKTKIQLLKYQDLSLNREAVELAIADGVLDARSFEDLVRRGLIDKKVKRYLKFCDPEVEDKRLEAFNKQNLRKSKYRRKKRSKN